METSAQAVMRRSADMAPVSEAGTSKPLSSRSSAARASLTVWDFVGLAVLPLLIVGLGFIFRRVRHAVERLPG
mgnify:CR=1 FL=1